ncbi:MAG: 3-methyl-2-oxobutanoate hydroxymethyltransferase [Desulfurococcaceae archaeon]
MTWAAELRKKVTVRDIVKMKGREKIVAITAYDYVTARLVDEAGVDLILVGDSVGMVVHGLPSTNYVNMDMMLLHVSSAARARTAALLVADMPFLSYEVDVSDAVRNAGALVRAGAEAVKIEGGAEMSDVVRALARAGIPVMGHIGLNPQRALLIGGYRKRGTKREEAEKIVEDARELERAGAFSLVIEFTEWEVAKRVTEEVSIPTICIGSGPFCDGQILVLHDVLGLSESPPPFAKKYVDLRKLVVDAVTSYARDVRSGAFPQGPETAQ